MTDTPTLSDHEWLFYVLWGRASDSAEGLADLAPLVHEFGQAYDSRPLTDIAAALPESVGLQPSRRQELIALGDNLLASAEVRINAVDASSLIAKAASADPLTLATDPIPFAIPMLNDAMASLALDALADELTTDAEARFLIAYLTETQRQPRAPTLRRALFVTAMATIEPLLLRLVPRLLYHRSPGTYTSLADVRLDRATRVVCRNPSSWHEALVVDNDLRELATTVPWDDITVAWEDRNSIHHRDGHEDPHKAGAQGRPVVARTDITLDYLVATIDRVQVTNLALVAAVSEEVLPGMAARLVLTTSMRYPAAFRASRWDLAMGLARLRGAYPRTSTDTLDAKVEEWLAIAGASGHDAVREEVQAWDTTDLEPIYEVARVILLNDLEPAARRVRALVASGVLADQQVAEWPLFDSLRRNSLLA